MRSAILVSSLLATLASCQIVRTPGVQIATSPPGARVLVDGRDSGFVTPCVLDLDREPQSLKLELEGYQAIERRVDERGEHWVIQWREMYLNQKVWRFPLWLNYVDGLTPWKIERGYSPERIFVRLRRAREE